MLPCTRRVRVGCLGLVGSSLLTAAGWAGPIGLSFESAEESSPITFTRVDVNRIDLTFRNPERRESNSLKTQWFAFDANPVGARAEPSPAVSKGSSQQQALSVPFEPISLTGLLAMTGGLLLVGKRMTGIRR